MRTIDQDGNDIINPDLVAGRLVDWRAPRKNAVPIDDITKFVWEDSDFEDVKMYIPWGAGEKEMQAEAKNVPSYEDLCAAQRLSDKAICELYEMIGGTTV